MRSKVPRSVFCVRRLYHFLFIRNQFSAPFLRRRQLYTLSNALIMNHDFICIGPNVFHKRINLYLSRHRCPPFSSRSHKSVILGRLNVSFVKCSRIIRTVERIHVIRLNKVCFSLLIIIIVIAFL
jgi:hypothetical protein